VSDTPRTNLEAFFPHDSMYQVCDSDFARKLERELQEANKRIKRLEEAGDEVVINYVNSLSAFEIWRKAKEAKP
jgi:hypothetical protein